MRARARTWTVDLVERHPRCTVLELAGTGGALTLIHPFDRPSVLRDTPRWRRSRVRAVTAALEAVLQGSLVERLEGGTAPLALPAWQLAVAWAMSSGLDMRVLLADAVGLGKTIQAGLALTALRSHGALAHALVLTPAGLRDQWVSELASRLGLVAWTADPACSRAARATLPVGVSPWLAHPLVVASIDYVKQPEVLAAAAAIPWDLLVLDEAHGVGTGSDRRVAAHALAVRATRVLLLSATPHAGDDEAYDALRSIGACGDLEPLVIRRSRDDVGLPRGSRLRVVRVPRSPAEHALHDALGAYASLVLDEQRPHAPVAMAWLMKRAASSPEALRRSVERRRALLASAPEAPLTPWLPFDDEVDERDDLDECAPAALASPGLGSLDREIRLLDDLAERAARAARSWSKGDRLVRWLSASHEPVVLFTEYRATLEALLALLPDGHEVAVLHGGLGRRARAAALSQFLEAHARVLLATDVASEGLNLQSRARSVLSIEMPWTPARLRQRIGRVDRLGQALAVRAACLVSRGGPEAHVAALVAGRLSRMRTALPDHDDTLDELSVLDAALGRGHGHVRGRRRQVDLPPPALGLPDRETTCAHAWLVQRAATRANRLRKPRPGVGVSYTRLRPRGHGDPLLGQAIVLFVSQALAPGGRPVARTTVAVAAHVDPSARRRKASSLLRRLAQHLAPHAARAAIQPLAEAHAAFERRTRAEIARLSRAPRDLAGPPLQPGLFDRRALADAALREAARGVGTAELVARIARLEASLGAPQTPPPAAVAAFFCW